MGFILLSFLGLSGKEYKEVIINEWQKNGQKLFFCSYGDSSYYTRNEQTILFAWRWVSLKTNANLRMEHTKCLEGTNEFYILMKTSQPSARGREESKHLFRLKKEDLRALPTIPASTLTHPNQLTPLINASEKMFIPIPIKREQYKEVILKEWQQNGQKLFFCSYGDYSYYTRNEQTILFAWKWLSLKMDANLFAGHTNCLEGANEFYVLKGSSLPAACGRGETNRLFRLKKEDLQALPTIPAGTLTHPNQLNSLINASEKMFIPIPTKLPEGRWRSPLSWRFQVKDDKLIASYFVGGERKDSLKEQGIECYIYDKKENGFVPQYKVKENPPAPETSPSLPRPEHSDAPAQSPLNAPARTFWATGSTLAACATGLFLWLKIRSRRKKD